jgi:nucleoside-diphosphate-sugar epimerase
MKIFLSGAGGFVGANMARRLLREGYEVHVSLRGNTNAWRLADIMDQLNAHKVDITDFAALSRTIKEVSPEGIIHMATYGAYPTAQKDLQKTLDTNLTGTINMVRACGQIRYECFINTSSSSEYGLVQKSMNEDDFPKPIDYYGATKAGATIFCQAHTRITEAPIITVRLFSVYGPYEEPIRLVPSTIKKCLGNEKLEFTQGMQKRDFIYTADVEDAYIELLRRPDLKGGILNIGTGSQHTVRDIVGAIIKETGTSSRPDFGALPTRQFESFNWVADMEKTHRLLKWRAKCNIAAGIRETVAWMRKNLGYYGVES